MEEHRDEMVAEGLVAEQAVLDPEGAVQKRIVLLGGAELRRLELDAMRGT